MRARTVFPSILLSCFALHAQNQLTVTDAASGLQLLAPGALASAFGTNFTTDTQSATTLPLPQVLGNIRVDVTDASGTSRHASLFFISPSQVNFIVPADTPPGVQFVTLLNGSGVPFRGTVRIQAAAPGVFSANGNGKGVAAAIGIRVVDVVGPQAFFPVFLCDAPANNCHALPINLGLDTPTFLALFGTGISGAQKVTVTVGGQPVPVLYAGPQGFPGLDQVNIGIPLSLRGAGLADVVVTADGVVSNTVQISIQ